MAVSVLSLASAICAERVFALASVNRAKSNGNSLPTCQSPGHCTSSRVEQFNSHSRRSSNETALVGRQLLRLRLRPTFRSKLRPKLRPTLRLMLRPTLWSTLRDTLWATMSPSLRPTLRLTLWPTLRPKAVQSRCCALQLAETNSESAMGMIFAYDRKHIAAVIAFDIASDKPFHMLAPKVFQNVSQRLFQVLVQKLVHCLVRTLADVSFERPFDIASDMSFVTLSASTD